VASYLVVGRFLRGRRLDNLLLAIGLGVLACANVVNAVLLAFSPTDTGRLVTSGANVVGATLLAAAAFAPGRPLARHRREGLFVVCAATVGTSLVVGALLLLDRAYGHPSTDVVGDATRPQLESDLGLVVAQALALAAFLLAAVGFARRADAERDPFRGFVAVGAVLAASARLHYIVFAPAASGLLRIGDIFRALFYIVLLIGAGREIEEYWEKLAQNAVLEERRRIARDLHDGVAQELAFISRRARRLSTRTEDDSAREIAASAERALGDSRRAIAALTRPLDQPLADVITEAVEEIAARYDIALDLELAPGVQVDADRREALVRIACEAVSNAARHGKAGLVHLRLSNGSGVRFAVVDDGVGFEPGNVAPSRFGIAIMRERAQAVGGSFRLVSAPGRGTEVEVVLP
jgi:signal transduction histidine kinase